MNSKKMIAVVVVVCGMLVMSAPKPVQALPEAQHEMNAALENLRQAQNNLQHASRDKGGHRSKALEHIRMAISEVEQGIQFDNTHESKKERN
jgi:hypothetical protein